MTAAVSLTPRQRDAFEFIARYIASHRGIAPSTDEIREALGLASKSSVSRLLAGLEARNHIRRLGRAQRSITLLASPQRLSTSNETVSLPPQLFIRLASYCRRHGEQLGDVLSDAIVIHLDQMDAVHAREAAEANHDAL